MGRLLKYVPVAVLCSLIFGVVARSDQGWQDNQDGENFTLSNVATVSANNLDLGGAVLSTAPSGQLVNGSITPGLTSGIVANWPLTTTRCYAVSYDHGNDSNVGYSDVSCAAAGAVALKTLTQLNAILPSVGNGRSVVILVETRSAGAMYLTPSGTNDSLALRGQSGYTFITARATGTSSTASATAFANDANDVAFKGAVQASGTNAGGYNPTGTPTAISFNVQDVGGGTAAIPVETNGWSDVTGMRFRFDASTPTTALRNKSQYIWSNTATSVTFCNAFPAVPTTSDFGYIEYAGAQVALVFTGVSGGALSLSGFYASVSGIDVTDQLETGVTTALTFLRGTSLESTSPTSINGVRVETGGATLNSPFGSVVSNTAVNSVFRYVAQQGTIQGGNVISGGLLIQANINDGGLVFPPASGSVLIGNFGSTTQQRLRMVPSNFLGVFSFVTVYQSTKIFGVDLEGSGTTGLNGIQLIGENLAISIDDAVGSAGVGSGIFTDDTLFGSEVMLAYQAPNTVTGGSGDIEIEGTFSHSYFPYADLRDIYNNHWSGNQDNQFVYPSIHGVSNFAGTVSPLTVVRQPTSIGFVPAQADNLTDASAILGVAIGITNAAGDETLVVVGGPTYIRFDSTPAVRDICYLSDVNRGQAKNTAPTAAGSVVIPLGVVIGLHPVDPTLALVRFSVPEQGNPLDVLHDLRVDGNTALNGTLTVTPLASSGTQCAELTSTGQLAGTGSACASGSGAVSTVSGADGVSCSPTTGSVVCTVANLTCGTNTWVSSASSSSGLQCTQPAFSNLSGQATLAQFPSIAADTILANPTGSAAVPQATSVMAPLGFAGTSLTNSQYHQSVKAVSTTNITLSGTQTVDGIALGVGDFEAATAQTTSSQNGIYVVASGAWTLRADWATGNVVSGTRFTADQGTNWHGSEWEVTTTGAITVGTTPVQLDMMAPDYGVQNNGTGTVIFPGAAPGSVRAWKPLQGGIQITNSAGGNVGLTVNDSGAVQLYGGGSNTVSLGTNGVPYFQVNNNTAQILVNASRLNVASTSLASANNLTLGSGNHFILTTTTNTIKCISSINWTAGSFVTLQLPSGSSVNNNDGSCSGSNAPIFLQYAQNIPNTLPITYTLVLQYNGSAWRQPSTFSELGTQFAPITRNINTTDGTLTGGGNLANDLTLARAAITGDVSIPAASNAATLANSGAGAGSCTFCSVQFDAKGREVTYSSNTTAGGDLAGTYPNPTVAAIHETSGPTRLPIGAIASGQQLYDVGGTIAGVSPHTSIPFQLAYVTNVTTSSLTAGQRYYFSTAPAAITGDVSIPSPGGSPWEYPQGQTIFSGADVAVQSVYLICNIISTAVTGGGTYDICISDDGVVIGCITGLANTPGLAASGEIPVASPASTDTFGLELDYGSGTVTSLVASWTCRLLGAN